MTLLKIWCAGFPLAEVPFVLFAICLYTLVRAFMAAASGSTTGGSSSNPTYRDAGKMKFYQTPSFIYALIWLVAAIAVYWAVSASYAGTVC